MYDYSLALADKTGFKVFYDEQFHWKRCIHCQCLVYYPDGGVCAGNSGGSHEYASQEYRLVGDWEPNLNAMNVNYAAHEMGHCYGLNHANLATVPPDVEYGDKWDVMGDGWSFTGPIFGPKGPGHFPPNGRSGPGLSAPSLDFLGWLPKDRIATFVTSGKTVTYRLFALNNTFRPDVRGHLMIKVPTPDRIFTIEFRHPQPSSWDFGIPRDGVLIHELRRPYSVGEKNWKCCKNCFSIAFAGDGKIPSGGICPAKLAFGGKHDFTGSPNYGVWRSEVDFRSEKGWKKCKNCQGIAYYSVSGKCPGGKKHDFGGSEDYRVGVNTPGAHGNSPFYRCQKCQGLFWGGNKEFRGLCPSRGWHESEKIYNPYEKTTSVNIYYLADSDDIRPFIIPPPGQDKYNADWKVGQKFLDRKRNISISIDKIDSRFSIATVTVGKI